MIRIAIERGSLMLAGQIQWILFITGLATAGAVVLFLAPARAMTMLCGRPPSDEIGIAAARHWGLLVCLVGALLVYAAFHADIRVPALIVAVIEKAAFALNMFLSPFRRRPAVIAVASPDAGMAAVYLLYLAGL